MAHLHLPDGVLPAWIVLGGWVLTLLLLALAIGLARRKAQRHRLPRMGFVAALMLLAMSIEIAPLAYHANLSTVAGILLGPALGFLAAFIVDTMLALLGHGGVTVIGLNTLLLGSEVVLGGLLFRGFRRLGLPPPLAASLAAVLSLFASTTGMLGIVAASGVAPGRLGHATQATFTTFALLILTLGSLGWLLEAVLTAAVVRYLVRVRPGLLGAP